MAQGDRNASEQLSSDSSKHANAAWNTDRPLVLSDSELEELRARFGFFPGFGVKFLRTQLDQAASYYFTHAPRPTAVQRRKRLNRISELASELVKELLEVNREATVPVMPPGILRLLIALGDTVAEHTAELSQAQSERGRQPTHGIRNFVLHLQGTFLRGTGRTAKYTWDEYSNRYRGALVEFIEVVARSYGISISNSAIAKAVKELRRSRKLYEPYKY